MLRTFPSLALCLTAVLEMAGTAAAQRLAGLPGDQQLADYFRRETDLLANRCLADIHSLSEWQARRAEYQRQLQEMLGLWPMPKRTELHPVVTGTLDQDHFTVERIHFQASPHLYVTGNLYLPKHLDKPAPAILYVCGHAPVITNGVSCGNKAAYQHHGAWFARNGYVCLLIDTLQLGEIQGLHHGTYREGQWWWNSRGYTPAGVEAWFGIRALDYLCSRPEVDQDRIGMTGRSGGGSYTWTVAALDGRIKVAAPVAGITDLQNQVVDGAVEGHCDCMFFLNSYRWDFPIVPALIAPRSLLIGNSDKDTIFPLDGVVRLHEKTKRIYSLYGATDKLGLLITEGPHSDTQDLQLPVLRWFNRFLKGEDPLIETAAKKIFDPLQLRVFDRLPEDQINTAIQESFVPMPVARAASDRQLAAMLHERVFPGWPGDEWPVTSTGPTASHNDLRVQAFRIQTQPDVELLLFVVRREKVKSIKEITLNILDSQTWSNSPASPVWLGGGTLDSWRTLSQDLKSGTALAFLAPRAVPPSNSTTDPKKMVHIRRRFMLLGQTLDGMRVWDIRCAVQALRSLREFKQSSLCVRAKGEMGVNAAYAALFEPEIRRLELKDLPASHMQGPDYLNVLKVTDIPQVLEVLRPRLFDSAALDEQLQGSRVEIR